MFFIFLFYFFSTHGWHSVLPLYRTLRLRELVLGNCSKLKKNSIEIFRKIDFVIENFHYPVLWDYAWNYDSRKKYRWLSWFHAFSERFSMGWQSWLPCYECHSSKRQKYVTIITHHPSHTTLIILIFCWSDIGLECFWHSWYIFHMTFY